MVNFVFSLDRPFVLGGGGGGIRAKKKLSRGLGTTRTSKAGTTCTHTLSGGLRLFRAQPVPPGCMSLGAGGGGGLGEGDYGLPD